jgi:penicillin-binding protein 1B
MIGGLPGRALERLRRRASPLPRDSEPRSRGRWWKIARLALLAVAVAGGVAFIAVDRGVARRFEARTSSFPSRVYGAPYTIARGAPVDPTALLEQLRRLDYVEVAAAPAGAGEFRRSGNDWEVYLRAAAMPEGQRDAGPVLLDVRRGRLRRIDDARTGEPLERFSLEPELLFTFYGALQEERRWTPLEEIPSSLLQAVEAVEDRRFRRHHGVDLIGIGRALLANLRAGGVVQGGSTVTQQLVKNLYGPGRRTLGRKLREAAGAVALELHYDKDLILEAYLNEVYLGQTGPVAISGVGEASRFHFGVNVTELDLPRCALLAGMIRNPGGYNPRLHPEEARARRELVLNLMQRAAAIDEPTRLSAVAAPLGVSDPTTGPGRYPWIEDRLAQEVRRVAPEAIPSRAGFSIFITFDPRIQRVASEALEQGLARLERRLGEKKEGEPLEGAIVVMRPSDGALLALVGGREYRRSQFNRAVSSRRSPGSTFKPFVFLAGFERAVADPEFSFTAASLFDDAPLEVPAAGGSWSPSNYDDTFRGPVSVRRALEDSVNVPTVRAALQVGLPAVVEAAQRCGIESPLEPIPSLALGTKEVTPLEMAVAYATLANGGWRVTPHGLAGLTDRHGNPFGEPHQRPLRAVEPEVAYLVTNLLVGVMQRGTARSSSRLGFTGHAAGKTGSSDALRDGWFVGYTADLLALVWVGYDDNRPVNAPGGVAALPIWVDLLSRIGDRGERSFERPRGIVSVEVDPTTGERAARGCPRVATEIFVAGSAPERHCEAHGGKKRRGFWRRVFNRRG